jgi:hypothetical protein
MSEMSIVSQVFLLFYAVIYGVVFTISGRWSPFFIRHSEKEGWYRLGLSLIFFGLLPVIYFIIALPRLLIVSKSDGLNLFLAVYCVSPLIAFYFLWAWIVLGWPDKYYTKSEKCHEPLLTSLELVGNEQVFTPVFKDVFWLVVIYFLLMPSVFLLLFHLRRIGQ